MLVKPVTCGNWSTVCAERGIAVCSQWPRRRGGALKGDLVNGTGVEQAPNNAYSLLFDYTLYRLDRK
jgi:hypothetical protein